MHHKKNKYIVYNPVPHFTLRFCAALKNRFLNPDKLWVFLFRNYFLKIWLIIISQKSKGEVSTAAEKEIDQLVYKLRFF